MNSLPQSHLPALEAGRSLAGGEWAFFSYCAQCCPVSAPLNVATGGNATLPAGVK